jgi:hypothetical protein
MLKIQLWFMAPFLVVSALVVSCAFWEEEIAPRIRRHADPSKNTDKGA